MRWFFYPAFQLALEIVLVTASEICVKIGAAQTASLAASGGEWLGVSGLASAWTWLGIVLVVLSFLCWTYVLRHMPLSTAYPVSNLVHVMIPIGSWILLSEAISPRRWLGIGIVVIGLALVAKPVATLEEKL